MSTTPEQRASVTLPLAEFLAPETFPAAVPGQEQEIAGRKATHKSSADGLAAYIHETTLRYLPNDLTRMIYLASLRDCNSGLYLHPELSQQEGVRVADRALRVCHEQVFRSLLITRLPDYVCQLEQYIRYTRGETATMLKTWKSLQAYRATVPVGAAATSAELFFLNIAIALEALTQGTPEPPAH